MSKRTYRRRRDSKEEQDDDNETEDSVIEKLIETRELQSIRKRQSGVSAIGLAYGKKCSNIEEKLAPDPFKLKTGGLINLKEISNEELQATDDEVVKRLTSQFSAETQTRDDETHMLKYIDDKMAELKGANKNERQLTDYEAKILSLYQMPERLKTDELKGSEEMLSNQMLSGIPEVDLGMDAKFKNIEQTEDAKQKILIQRAEKKARSSSSSYIHHNLRFYTEKSKKLSEETQIKEPVEPKVVYIPVVGIHDEPELKASIATEGVVKRKPDNAQLASDDYHYDKFKKRVRRY